MIIDVTKELEDEVLEIKIFDETFKVYDIPLSVFLKAKNDEGAMETLIERLSCMLKMSEEDVISKIGIKTARLINQKAMDWLNAKMEENRQIPLSGSEQ